MNLCELNISYRVYKSGYFFSPIHRFNVKWIVLIVSTITNDREVFHFNQTAYKSYDF